MAATDFSKWVSSLSHSFVLYLNGLFNVSTGHDHDGVNSKLVVGGTPTDGSVTTAKLADGALAASATGLEKMADGYLAASTAGRAKMADGFVTTAKIGDAQVTAAKLASDVPGSGLVANGTSGALDLDVDDTTIEVDGTNGVQVKAASLGTAHLAADAGITGSQLAAAAAIAGSQLAADAGITGSQLAADAGITGSQLAPDAAIAGTQLAAGVQTSLGLADTAMQAITAAKLVGTGIVQTVRRRCTIAEINAGQEILAAVADVKYRLVGAEMIAVGGAVTSTTATGVGIVGTQGAASAVLADVAKASLTENTWVNALGAGTILAAGASLVACDANTAITAAAQGDTDLATATHVDVIVHYVTEA